jgi:DME family drug/metabolite transporter
MGDGAGCQADEEAPHQLPGLDFFQPIGHVAHPGRRACACALTSTALLVGGRPQDGIDTSLAGVLLALDPATGYAILTLCGRTIAGRAHPLQANALAFAAGAILLLALPTHLVVANPTALAYGLILVGMRAIPATIASIITLIELLTATVFARLLVGE